MRELRARANRKGESGFTLIEALISIAITIIVMASVFGLLTKGQRSFEREPEIADMQQSARTVLDMVSKDILQAGGGLPPELPAFTRVNGTGDGNPTDSIEMVGTFQSAGNAYLEAEEVQTIQDSTVLLVANTTNFNVGDIAVLFNDTPLNDPNGLLPAWAMGLVLEVVPDPLVTGNARVTIDFTAFDPAYSNHSAGDGNPPTSFEMNLAPPARVPRLVRVSVVRYFTQLDNAELYTGTPPQLLMRDVDFSGQPQAVGYLEDFQINYVIGITAPLEQVNPPDPISDVGIGNAVTAENMLSSVRVTVTARSIRAGMEGASEGVLVGNETDDFIRKTFSTNVNPRNLSAALDVRVLTGPP